MLDKLPRIIPVVDMVAVPMTTTPSSIVSTLVMVVMRSALATNTTTTPLTVSIVVVVAVLLVAEPQYSPGFHTPRAPNPAHGFPHGGGQARGGVGGRCIRQPGGGLHPNNRNMSKSKGWTLQGSLLTLWMDENSSQQSNKNC